MYKYRRMCGSGCTVLVIAVIIVDTGNTADTASTVDSENTVESKCC